VVVRSNTGFVYVPDPNVVGTDTFRYKVNDGAVDSNVATVAIDVGNLKHAPSGVDHTVNVGPDRRT